MSREISELPATPAPGRGRALLWSVAGATMLMALTVVARVPLWGRLAWGVHDTPNFVANLPLLSVMALLFWAHAAWTKTATASLRQHVGRVAGFGALMLMLCLSARLGENAGWGRFALLTVNPAAGGFFEAAYDSRDNPNWLRDYPALMKKYHHVHSHPPAPVKVMRW